jgi:prolyl oligopeptidase
MNSGVSPHSEWYLAPINTLLNQPVPWRKLASLEDKVSRYAIRGDELFLLTNKNAPRYKIIRTSTTNPDVATAELFFQGDDAIVERMKAAKDALYVQTLNGGSRQLHRVDYQTRKAVLVPLPYAGSVRLAFADSEREGAFFELTSWTKSPAFYQVSPDAQPANTGLMPPYPVEMSDIVSTRVEVKSHDGVKVPLVILYKKGLKRDGRNPTLLQGYGAYGFEVTSPRFAKDYLPWLERGGVLAIAGVRGGGEYGEAWHLAGMKATKPNTWKDFIVCAEYLVRQGYTSPKRLAGRGRSAGGILIGNAIAERPDLFGAAIIEVGVNNPLRGETTANGVPNVAEFGSYQTREGFEALLAMDPYHKLKAGTAYPAVLLAHGINDTRVEPWMSGKMAARLQATTASGNPVLLRIEYDAGHGIGSTKDQRNRERADMFAFLFEELVL